MLGQFGRRAARPANQFAAAVRTDAGQGSLRAFLAEGAFEAADHGQRRVGWQVAIAAFTAGSKGEHGFSIGVLSKDA